MGFFTCRYHKEMIRQLSHNRRFFCPEGMQIAPNHSAFTDNCGLTVNIGPNLRRRIFVNGAATRYPLFGAPGAPPAPESVD